MINAQNLHLLQFQLQQMEVVGRREVLPALFQSAGGEITVRY